MENFTNYSETGNANTLAKFLHAPIGILGIICNTLAILVFQRKQLKKFSYSFFWTVLLVFENLLLLFSFKHWTKEFLAVDIYTISQFYCSLNNYLPYVIGTFSIYVEMLIILDRFITIIYGKKCNIMKQKSFKIIVLLIMFVASLLVNIKIFFDYRLDINHGKLTCITSVESKMFHSIIRLINIFIFNLIINPILDMKIISLIVSTRGNRGLLNRSAVIDRQFAISAITINILSLVIKLPFSIGSILAVYFNLDSENFELVYTISGSISLIDKSDSFLINIIVNSVFRREFLSMIRLFKQEDQKRKLSLASNMISMTRSREIASQPDANEILLVR